MNRPDGLDFADRAAPDQFEQHPDMPIYNPNAQPSRTLQRNKTERVRLQGLQRANTATGPPSPPPKATGLLGRWDVWMINEGGRILFFGVWIFLHLIVTVFGFIHYSLKDNSEGARATFGITFRQFGILFVIETASDLFQLQPSPVRQRSSCTSMPRSSSCPSAGTSSPCSGAPR